MANQPNNTESHEIDLGRISRKMKHYASRANDSFFDGILFVKKYLIVLAVLIIGGYFLGKYMDGKKDIYTHKLYVIPNFGSVDYLYTKVEHLQSKLRERDTEFLNKAGLSHAHIIGAIEIEPVVDVYPFIEDAETRNFELLKLMSENSDITKVMEDEVTSKNYKHHLITITTKGKTSEEQTVKPFMDYLNNSEYFKVIQKEGIKSIEARIATTDTTLKQIDAVLNEFSRSGKGGNLVYYNDNTPLDEVIKLKGELTEEQAENKVDLINSDRIIKDSSVALNSKKTSALQMKYIVPLVFVIIFVGIIMFIAYYRSQMRKRKPAVTEQAP